MIRTNWEGIVKVGLYRNTLSNRKGKISKGYRQLIAIDLEMRMSLIEENPPDIPGFKISRLKYLIHLVLSHKKKYDRHAYSILNMEYMRKIVPQAGEYFKFLKSQGIVEWLNYSKNRNSRLYRLVEEPRVGVRIITDSYLIKRIENVRNARKRRLCNKYPCLNRWIKKVEIDYNGARSTILREYNSTKDKGEAERKRSFCLAKVISIYEKELYITVNDTNNRLDSNFTNLPTSLLKHLSIDGQKLMEIDISNSQPYFVLSLFEPTRVIQEILNDYDKEILKFIQKFNFKEFEDVKRYKSLVMNGKLYEYLGKEFKKNDLPFKSRKDLKKQIFIVFFGDINAPNYNEVAKIFKKCFPNISALFKFIKRPKKNRLAIILQRIEAFTMLEMVAKRISSTLPDLPFLTRHDSILPIFIPRKNTSIDDSKEYYLDTVRMIFLNTIEEVVGFKPSGRMKKLI